MQNLAVCGLFSIFARILRARLEALSSSEKTKKDKNMNKKLATLALFAFSTIGSLQAKTEVDPVVMTINNKPVKASEFNYFYHKNSQQELADTLTFDEYVDLFVNYKLKVEEALSRSVDTTQAYLNDLETYRKQLIEPYLQPKDWQKACVDLAVERQNQEVHAQHILIRLEPSASPVEVAAAYKKLEDARQQIEAGAKFDSLAAVMSEDPSARQNGGDLGYFSAMQMVYPFENAAFECEPGQLTSCRSQFGLHLIKVVDKRDGKGEVLAAHIMKFFDRSLPQAVAAEKLRPVMDSIYNELMKPGRIFGEVCQQTSEDQYTAQGGGSYGWLNSSARFPQEWLDVAFSLKKGEISKPFKSNVGWHIMTVLDKHDRINPDSETRDKMQAQLVRDPERVKAAELQQQAVWAQEDDIRLDAKMVAKVKQTLADSAKAEGLSSMNKPLLLIGKKTKYTVAQWAEWMLAEHKMLPEASVVDLYLTDWMHSVVRDYEEAHLTEKNAEFANVYREYHDGLLLFEVANGEVWDKAQTDKEGREAFFEQNRKKYGWEFPRFKGAFIECADNEALVKKLTEIYESTPDIQAAAERVRNEVLTDTLLTPNPKQPLFHIVNGIYQKGDNPTVDHDRLGQTEVKVTPRSAMPVQMTYGKILADGPECADDVKGAVVADYQNELEKQWVAKLREKFTFSINQKELDKLR